MQNIRIVLHGKAAANQLLRDAVAQQRQAGHDISVRVTWEAGDTQRLTREAINEGVDTIVAGGGDGSVNEVVSALADYTQEGKVLPAVGILPLGTANDFARSAAIPLEPDKALALITTQPGIPVDIGRVHDRYFINVATGGFGTQVTLETHPELKKLLGGTAYLLTGLTRFNSITDAEGSFKGPGFEWSGKFLVLAIANGRQAGGGHVLCPEATINDGLLDIRILPSLPNAQIADTLSMIMRDGLEAVERLLVSARLPWVDVEAVNGLSMNLDGEPVSGTAARFEILPGAIHLHLPRKSPLLKS